jgi:hypothetical protein
MAALLLLLLALAPAKAQTVVFKGQIAPLEVEQKGYDTYTWELYKDSTVNFAIVDGDPMPSSYAEFVGDNAGPLVNVKWLEPGTFFFKVRAVNVAGCTMNLKIGIIKVIEAKPTAVIVSPDLMMTCIDEPTTLEVVLTGSGPWEFSYTDGTTIETVKGITDPNYQLKVNPKSTTVYWITEVKDMFESNSDDSNSVMVVVNPKPVIGKIYQWEP